MTFVDPYKRQLTDKEILSGAHREFVGGLWEELGNLQFEFLLENGLRPGHQLCDVGCGALRGGLKFIEYLDASNYCGLDVNESLIQAGLIELKAAGLEAKAPQLLVDDKFRVSRFERDFDFALSVSVFTHLPMNDIVRCIREVTQSLAENGSYYTTFFQAPEACLLTPLKHAPGGITTHYDDDPFHYSFEEMQALATFAGAGVELIGNWSHPRNQQMLRFFRA